VADSGRAKSKGTRYIGARFPGPGMNPKHG